MSDQDLRELEREAIAGDAAAKLRGARAFERVGRRAEGARLLRRALDDAGARSELLRYPAWTHAAGDAGRARFLDAEPVVVAPRVLWKALARSSPYENPLATHLLASPLGVVATTRRGFRVFSVDDGALLWSDESWSRRGPPRSSVWTGHLALHGESLFVRFASDLGRYQLLDPSRRRLFWVTGGRGEELVVEGELFLVARDGTVNAYAVGEGVTAVHRWRTESIGVPSAIEAVAADRVVVVGRTNALLDRGTA